jgi:hypothetical protein
MDSLGGGGESQDNYNPDETRTEYLYTSTPSHISRQYAMILLQRSANTIHRSNKAI